MSDEGAEAARFIGHTVGNRFQLRSLLGVGGMASVFLAHDSVLERDVAVKTLHSELGREQSFRDRFRREAQSVAKLTHTNIVSVHDSGEDRIAGATVPYIVMEYVEGRPLRTVLDEDITRHGAMPAEKALKITGDVLGALGVSHEMGLVHRDIKPGNVMLNKRGEVKVMDFGIARAMQSGVTSMTQTGMVVGTPQYLSPEQALGRGVDPRSDLYSVGIMLFELLTGRLPFDADSALGIAYAHVQEEPPAPSSVNRSVPPAVDALVARALRKNPDERFPSAEAMRDECARAVGTGAGAAPIIISGGPSANSGAGVGQAVFPPVAGSSTPPPHPQAYAQPVGSFGPSTPPPGPVPGPAPAVPSPAAGYPSPAPFPQPAGPSTPPPAWGGAPAPTGTAQRKNNGPMIVGVVLASLVVLLVLIGVLANGSGSSGEEVNGAGSSYDPSVSGSDDGSSEDTVPEDNGKTIETEKCTDATESYSDPDKVLIPDFKTKNLESVKACVNAAGWKLGDITYEDENVWGRNAVLDQEPSGVDEFDPDGDEIDLTVSTGKG